MTEQEQRFELLIYRIKDNCYEVAKKLLKAYSEQIRADAIEECIKTVTDYCGGLPNNNLINELEKLKE